MRIQPRRDFTLVDMARAFSVAAHTAVDQKRKYTGEDYHHHPEEVLQILLTYCDPDEAEQAAALLHDIIEDTATTREHIARVFGQDVGGLVVEVSDVSTAADGNRKVRKAMDREHLSQASRRGKRLKCADLISNSSSITKHDPAFAKTYLEEKLFILFDFYGEMINEPIYRKAMRQCQEAFAALYPDQKMYDKKVGKLTHGQPDMFMDIFNGDDQ